ncbi:MAG TPA: glycoside hydrolase family 18 protein [Polyangiaceae bacterium]|jgi:chitinase|nr:glycoside hydrolase family 18 protein [Polyangiaceae bacterium]
MRSFSLRSVALPFLLPWLASSACGSSATPDDGTKAGPLPDAAAGFAPDAAAGFALDAAIGADGETSDPGAPAKDATAAPAPASDASAQDATASTDASTPSGASGLWVMGYYSGWDAQNLPVAQIPWSDLTHIATAFMIPDGTGGFTSASDPNNASFDPTLAQSVISAAHAAGKKAIASIGGADSSTAFEASTTSTTMAPFVARLKALVTSTGYDGIDIDWEGGPTSDDALLLSLIMNLRAALPAAPLTMTAGTINQNQMPTDLATLYAAAAPSVDQINLMTYGMSGAYQGWKSWHSSPLHWNHDDSTPSGIDSTVSAYLAAGVPANKLGIGSGFYGECYTSPVTMPDQTLGASTVAASDGFGNLSYRDLVTTYLPIGTRQWDTGAMVPYLSITASNPYDCTYVTYEDAQSIAAKGAWAKSQGLGGAIIWTINEGYVPAADAGSQNPVLDAMGAAFLR